MPLVDYSSSDPDAEAEAREDEAGPPSRKKRRTSSPPGPRRQGKTTTDGSLPSLPAAFHDLYASTVRVSTVDDPSLHQGRRRQIPHVPGQWPTHVYAEWHPAATERALLDGLLTTLRSRIITSSSSSTITSSTRTNTDGTGDPDPDPAAGLHSLLTSDLGAPLPLHISLSRPLALPTAHRDGFRAELRRALDASGVRPFDLSPTRPAWHRTAESARSFLVLTVASGGGGDGGGGDVDVDADLDHDHVHAHDNTELTTLLRCCNATARHFGQPALYAGADAAAAFHVSVGWSFAEPTAELRALTDDVYSSAAYRDRIPRFRIRVEGVKVKIGNAVTHVLLPVPGRPSLACLGEG